MQSSVERKQIVNTLNYYEFDVLVIGGGITGAGIALDAVTRGMSVALGGNARFCCRNFK